MQIGANIIDNWDADNLRPFINFAGNELAGVENLPYLNSSSSFQIFQPQGGGGYFDAWLVPFAVDPHQNGGNATAQCALL